MIILGYYRVLSHMNNKNKFCFNISYKASRSTNWGRTGDWEFGPMRLLLVPESVFRSLDNSVKLIKKLLGIVMVYIKGC